MLSRYLLRPKSDFCFKPAESDTQARLRRHEERKTPLSYGNRPGTNKKGSQAFTEHYDVAAYRKAISRACKQADIKHWHPHQLRHTAATQIRGRFGLDAARAVLGHRKLGITDEYAELDLAKAANVAAEIG